MKNIVPPTIEELERYTEIMYLHEVDAARDRLYHEGFDPDKVSADVLEELVLNFEKERTIDVADAETWTKVIHNYNNSHVGVFALFDLETACQG